MPSFSWRHNHLHVQRDLDFVPYHETSIVECWAVRKTEILTVEFCGSGYRSPLQSPRILDRRFRLGHVQHNGFRHTMNRKIASNFEMSRTPFLDLRRFKRHRRILRNIQKIRTLQVLVAVWFPRVDRGGIDRHLDRGLCHVALAHVHRSVECVKLPAHLRNHQMRHGKLRGTVLRIDLVDRSLRKSRLPRNGHQATRGKHLRKIPFHSFFSAPACVPPQLNQSPAGFAPGCASLWPPEGPINRKAFLTDGFLFLLRSSCDLHSRQCPQRPRAASQKIESLPDYSATGHCG